MVISLRSWGVGVTLTLVLAVVAAAQSSTGRLSGTVATSDGARLPHATVTLVDRSSAREIRGTSDELGTFILDRVPAGTYTLRVDFPKLAPARHRDGRRVATPTTPASP
ncbi:MAG: carboxypeptidase-like regulatory domain-containing protein [Vicinamibacterales bacterium]